MFLKHILNVLINSQVNNFDVMEREQNFFFIGVKQYCNRRGLVGSVLAY